MSNLSNRLRCLAFSATLAHFASAAQAERAAVGDLVEYVSGLGPTLAEIVEGPDAANYVVVQLPTSKKVPVNLAKLRLVQKAGTPNAPMKIGESVRWVEGNVAERGSLVKVNGKWCQVKSASATTVGWVECSALDTGAKAPAKTAEPAAPKKAHQIKLQGNWENADGMMKLELQGANKCFVSMGPISSACSYKQTVEGVNVLVDGEEMVFLANEDGSLSSKGDSDAMMSIRLKKK